MIATHRRTQVRVGARTVETVEHLLAALCGLGFWNVEIEVDGDELPILDGSARPWVEALEPWGEPDTIAPIVLDRVVDVSCAEVIARASPAPKLSVDCTIEFAHPSIGVSRLFWDGRAETFRRDIAPARTFGFVRELEALRATGLIAGGSLDNALLFDADGPVNEPRGPKEPAAHKLLDVIGDLALLGRPLRAAIVLRRPGHALTQKLVNAIDAGARHGSQELEPAK